jgi:RNA polymerase sigma-70 factor (ECF subfamily)
MTAGTAPAGGKALAEAFEAQRPRRVRVAYATVGSVAEAEDCVQEAWLRLRRVEDPAGIRNLGAWLTTTVSRLALDALGRAQVRRERYVGQWLPEPLVEDAAAGDPADQVTLDESVSMALLVVLERLSPAERTSFLLHNVFGLSFAEVAGVVGRSPAAVRRAWWCWTPTACCRSSRSPWTAAGSPPSMWFATRTSSAASRSRAERPGPQSLLAGQDRLKFWNAPV